MCIAVITNVRKAAFLAGASYGQGIVICRTHKGWSAPVFIHPATGEMLAFAQVTRSVVPLELVSRSQKDTISAEAGPSVGKLLKTPSQGR